MGGENSKEQTDHQRDIEKTQESQESAGHGKRVQFDTNVSVHQATKDDGKPKVKYLGLREGDDDEQLESTSYDIKDIDERIVLFKHELFDKGSTKKVAESFLQDCPEGFDFLLSVLLDNTRKDPEKKFQKL